MTQEQLVSLIMKELDRQQIYLFDCEDLASVGIDGHLNVIRLAQAITKTDTSDETVAAEARLDEPLTRREVLGALETVAGEFGTSDARNMVLRLMEALR